MRSKKNEQHIRQLLARVGAEQLFSKQLSQVSGGELQRVMIAYALADGANVLCLDEPAAGIDMGGGQTVYELLKELSTQERRTIIIISHELDIVFKYADEVVCIDKRMICRGRPAAVLTSETIERMYGSHTAFYSHDAGHLHTHDHV
jgi:zinc transport system ATP-binding protein